jgi:acetyl-CoA synthetase
MSASSIDSHLLENRVFPVPAEFAAQANIDEARFNALKAEAEQDREGFWKRLAREHLHWITPFQQGLDASAAPFYRWFADGRLNVSANCLDVHLHGAQRHKAALIFEGEKGEVRTLTYAQLHREVCIFANALKRQGIGPGDRVAIYMPMVPEAVIAMLACARIGAIHSVVFGG